MQSSWTKHFLPVRPEDKDFPDYPNLMKFTEQLMDGGENYGSPSPGGIRELLYIAFPMVVSSACETIMSFTDRLFLSRLGPEHMSASMGGWLVSFTLTSFFIGLIGFSTALVAQYLGSGRKNHCSVVIVQALGIAMVSGGLVILMVPAANSLMNHLGIDLKQLALQKIYFNLVIYAGVIGLFRHVLSCFFSGIGRTRIIMISALVAMVVNVGGNYVLIFGKLGFPAYGIQGAGYGTILGSLCGLLVLAAAYFSKANRHEFMIFNNWGFESETMKKLLRFGSPMGVEMLLNFVAFTGLIMAFHSHGLVVASAITIVFNWDMVSYVPLIGLEIGMISISGRYMGARRPDIVRKAAASGLKIGWIYSTVVLLFFVFLPHLLVGIFSPAKETPLFAEVEPLAVTMLRMASLYVMTEAVIVIFIGVLRGAGDTYWTMAASVILHWMLLPIPLIIMNLLGYSVIVAWGGVILVFMTFSLVFFLRYQSGKWEQMKVVHAPIEDMVPPSGHLPGN